MPRSRSQVRVALSSGASASEPGREFVQERLRVFGFWSCTLSFFFLALRFVGEGLVDPSFSALRLVGSAGVLFHACASGVGGLLWAIAYYSPPLPLSRLCQLEAGATVVIGTCFAIMEASLAVTGSVVTPGAGGGPWARSRTPGRQAGQHHPRGTRRGARRGEGRRLRPRDAARER